MTMPTTTAQQFLDTFEYPYLRAYVYSRKPIPTPVTIVTDPVTGKEKRKKGPRHPSMYKNKRRGVVVAVKVGNEVFYGWSLCKHQYDEFDAAAGTTIAIKRALATADPNYNYHGYPQSVLDAMVDMEYRASQYFKGCSV